MQLRPYQEEAIEQVQYEWRNGARNVMMVLPTGAGKTHTKSALTARLNVPTLTIAHRQELILQISESLAGAGVNHKVVGPKQLTKFCAERHKKKYGRVLLSGQKVIVGSVQTLTRRTEMAQFFNQVKFFDIDEAHHVLPTNQWGQMVEKLPNAFGLGVTATPLRCDRKPLDGVFDAMVVGPSARDMINAGYLSDYRIFCPPVSIDLGRVRVSQSSGEYVRAELVDATHESSIVGDVVHHYTQIAWGKRGLTFCVDLESARQVTNAYNAAGIPAAYCDGKTPDVERVDILERLATGELWQVVCVDLFGEGMDCPALEVVTMARPTQSYGLYCQMFGRALRPFPGKTHAIIIDHVSNVVTHGLPDAPRQWSLSVARARRDDPDEIAMTVCDNCMQPREAYIKICPWCGSQNVPQERGTPAAVDGELMELDPEVLARMRGEIIDLESHPNIRPNASQAEAMRRMREHHELLGAQAQLRDAISQWAGVYRHVHQMPHADIQRLFFQRFKVDVMSAAALRAKEAIELREKIENG